jgi:universal stress protein A
VGLIVMSSEGRSGARKMFFGSTTERVLRETPVPVLVTPPAHGHGDVAAEVAARQLNRIIVPVDLAVSATPQLQAASRIATALRVPLVLVHVLEPVSIFEPVAASGDGMPAVNADLRRETRHRLERLIGADARAFTDVSEIVVAGKPYKEILRVASEQSADLIVVGAHGGPLGLPAFGSTTTHVLQEALCPVLTVHT